MSRLFWNLGFVPPLNRSGQKSDTSGKCSLVSPRSADFALGPIFWTNQKRRSSESSPPKKGGRQSSSPTKNTVTSDPQTFGRPGGTASKRDPSAMRSTPPLVALVAFDAVRVLPAIGVSNLPQQAAFSELGLQRSTGRVPAGHGNGVPNTKGTTNTIEMV